MTAKTKTTLITVAACVLSFLAGRMTRQDNKPAGPLQTARPRQVAEPVTMEKPSSPVTTAARTTYASVLEPPTAEEEAKTPVERVRDAMTEANEARRLQLFWRALTELKPEDARPIQDLFDDGDRLGRHYVPEYRYFAQRWGEVDGPAAMAHAMETWQGKGYMFQMMSKMAHGWASQEPQEVADWFNQRIDAQPWMQDAVLEGLVGGMADTDIDFARRFVEGQIGEPHADKYLALLTDKYVYSQGLEEAERWFASLDAAELGSSKPRMFDHLTGLFLRGGPEQGAAFVSRHADQPWMEKEVVSRVFSDLSRADTAKAEAWAATLPETWRTQLAIDP